MSIRQKDYDDIFNLRFEDHAVLNGLDHCKKDLSRTYYADVEVYKISNKQSELPLVFDLYSNLSLIEILIYHEKGMWGSLNPCNGEKLKTLCFDKAIEELKKKNSQFIRVEEFNIFLSDCAIIVKRIYEKSVEEQLNNIFNALAEHYVYLTKNLSITPYEIFVPVFSEDLLIDNNSTLSDSPEGSFHDYFNYWGLYFADEEDAVIYDLKKRSFISGELYMLDQ